MVWPQTSYLIFSGLLAREWLKKCPLVSKLTKEKGMDWEKRDDFKVKSSCVGNRLEWQESERTGAVPRYQQVFVALGALLLPFASPSSVKPATHCPHIYTQLSQQEGEPHTSKCPDVPLPVFSHLVYISHQLPPRGLFKIFTFSVMTLPPSLAHRSADRELAYVNQDHAGSVVL